MTDERNTQVGLAERAHLAHRKLPVSATATAFLLRSMQIAAFFEAPYRRTSPISCAAAMPARIPMPPKARSALPASASA